MRKLLKSIPLDELKSICALQAENTLLGKEMFF
eukprot:CAMPEP_0116884860 /NCGR_PEP_ID=MMETSP0463-20121206/17937_1 /TAXON_ID=181622 /ORGANISM="Strombidinopsis sp, Strain SopsisLIS2011" /LENGTH=32 /DNA_ID= /DNA_START= /DNA_END= /DNA_ORIENTATION=